MLRWIVLGLAVLMVAFSALTVLRAPSWTPWRLAVVAGEYGHWFAIPALLAAGLVWGTRSGGGFLAVATAVVWCVAALLLLKPALQAARVARDLPRVLTNQFGAARPPETAPFAFGRLFAGSPPPVVAPRTLEVAPGLPLDLYPASRRDGRRAPCVVIVHGGGWDSGDRAQIPHFNHWLAQQGYAVAAVSYRLAPRHTWPAPREDVLAACAYLRRHAPELGIDAERLVLLGRSAGGQIAQVLAYTVAEPWLRGVIGLYSPSDLLFGYAHADENDMLKSPALMRQYLGGTPSTAAENYRSASALLHVTERAPPSLLLHGENDALVWHRHSVRLEVRLAEVRVPRAFVSLPWATHAFDYNLHGPGGQLTTFAISWFLERVTAVE